MSTNESLITEVFKNMNFEDESISKNDSARATPDLSEIFRSDTIPRSFTDAVDTAAKAQIHWKKLSAFTRYDLLHTVRNELKKKSEALPSSQYNFSLLVDYFDLYSDMGVQVENLLVEPVGVVLVVLPPNPCFFFIGATVSAALAAGCTLIVHTEQPVIPLFLEEVLTKADLPYGVFNVVTEPLTDYNKFSKKIQKTIYCGSFSAAQNFYFEKKFKSFNFFCPNNTAALILESCDINAAVSSIFQKTWEDASFSAVSTVVVQESIYLEFLDVLQFQMRQCLNTNINKLKLEDKEILEKFNTVILKIVKAGGKDMTTLYKENEWMKTTLVNSQNQKKDLPIFKILICRTPKEGAMLLNKCHLAFGTSIWSECSAQALEISVQLESPNIWINCHGVVEAVVPLSLTNLNGNFVLGGRHGILEYLSTGERQLHRIMGPCKKISQKSEVLQTVYSAKQAFDSWQTNKNKKTYLKALACYWRTKGEFVDEADNFKYFTSLTNSLYHAEKNSTDEFFIVYEKVPVGVISLFISCETDTKTLISLIALPIALGNVVILVMEEQSMFVSDLIDFCNELFQKNLLTVVYGNDAGLYLASDPNIQALWVYDEIVSTTEELRKESAKNLKHLWVIPEFRASCEIFVMQCVKPKTIWLPKVEKFPK